MAVRRKKTASRVSTKLAKRAPATPVITRPKSGTICASWFGAFIVKPEKGSQAPKGTRYAVLWGGEVAQARCTCSGYNFTVNPKRCKHVVWVLERGCFYTGGSVAVPTHADRVRNKRGFAKDPHSFSIPMDHPLSERPKLTTSVCPNCEGPMIKL